MPMLEIITCAVSAACAALGLLGGLVLLGRSRTRAGRALALSLGALALLQASWLGYVLGGSLAFLQASFVLELLCMGAFILVAVSLQGRYSRLDRGAHRLRWLSLGACGLYAGASIFLPEYVLQARDGALVVGLLGQVQSVALLGLCVVFLWILENEYRALGDEARRSLTYPLLGMGIVGAALLLLSVSRLSTLDVTDDILLLSALMQLVGVGIIIFFSVRYRLFLMDIFVSRYVVYHSLTFLLVGGYLLIMGLILVGVGRLGLELPFVAAGAFVFVVLLVLVFLVISTAARARLRFFINTHFFANKYDYRKEWSDLSRDLAITFDERQIVHVTAAIILDSMYLGELSIWIRQGDRYRCVFAFPSPLENSLLAGAELFETYIEHNPYFLRKAPCRSDDTQWERVLKVHGGLLEENSIELAVPMRAGNLPLGFIAVGRENPGTPYGRDDIDLLSAIALQSSAALMSARYVQELAQNKELDAFNRMGAQVLHDLKNAAGNLSLILQNAPRYMDRPEFREDMLEAVRESLGRIDKVMGRFGSLPPREEVRAREVELQQIFHELASRLRPRLKGIHLIQEIAPGLVVHTDPELLSRIGENLLVNAAEAVQEGGEVVVAAHRDAGAILITLADNGPGFPEGFIEQRLFRPFQTTKERGTGLGLWQVRYMVEQLHGTIEVANLPDCGARISIRIPESLPPAGGSDPE